MSQTSHRTHHSPCAPPTRALRRARRTSGRRPLSRNRRSTRDASGERRDADRARDELAPRRPVLLDEDVRDLLAVLRLEDDLLVEHLLEEHRRVDLSSPARGGAARGRDRGGRGPGRRRARKPQLLVREADRNQLPGAVIRRPAPGPPDGPPRAHDVDDDAPPRRIPCEGDVVAVLEAIDTVKLVRGVVHCDDERYPEAPGEKRSSWATRFTSGAGPGVGGACMRLVGVSLVVLRQPSALRGQRPET